MVNNNNNNNRLCRRCSKMFDGMTEDYAVIEEPGPGGDSFFLCTSCWQVVKSVIIANYEKPIMLRCHNCPEIHEFGPKYMQMLPDFVYTCKATGAGLAYSSQQIFQLKDGTYVSNDSLWIYKLEDFKEPRSLYLDLFYKELRKAQIKGGCMP